MSPDGTYFALYAVAGHNGTAPLKSYEHCRISLEAGGQQSVLQSFVQVTPTGASTPPAARWKVGAFIASPSNSPNVGGSTYLYLGGGAATGSNPVDDLDYAVIDWTNGGALTGGFTTLGGSASMRQQLGYGAIVANNYLYAFGGKQTIDTSNTCFQAHICNNDSLGCTGSFAPEFDNWTNTMESMLVPRRLLGIAAESAFIYLLGGESVGGPTATTEMTIW